MRGPWTRRSALRRAIGAMPAPKRYVVRSVGRAGAVASLEPLAVVLALAFVIAPALLIFVPVELLVLARFIGQGTYVDDDEIVLRGPFGTRRVARADVR